MRNLLEHEGSAIKTMGKTLFHQNQETTEPTTGTMHQAKWKQIITTTILLQCHTKCTSSQDNVQTIMRAQLLLALDTIRDQFT